ncbi:hypothetical protein STANM309S_00227 [Streptomyces tanashiensis]
MNEQQTMPPPPPPAEITYSGQYSINPLAEVSFRRMCAQIPAVLGRVARLSWRTDRRAVQLLVGCQLITGVSAAVLLPATARAVEPVLGTGSAGERLGGALPALLVVALAAALARTAGAVASYAERRITPRLTQIVLGGTLTGQLFWAPASGTSQRSLPHAVFDPGFQGRMQSASTTLTAGTRPLAAVTAGVRVLVIDVRATLAVGALLQVLPVVLLLASPIRALREIPARAAVPPAREGA